MSDFISIQDIQSVKSITEFEFRPKTEQLKALDDARREGNLIQFRYAGVMYEGRVKSIIYYSSMGSFSAIVNGVALTE